MKFSSILIICLSAAVLASCAKPPIAEMDSAREAVLRAENNQDAVLYAGSSLARARDALKKMENEANSKRYDTAKTYAAEAVAAAESAIADGRTGAARARDQAATMLDGIGPAISETANNLNAARAARLDLDYQQLNSELDSAKRDLEQAKNYYDSRKYQEAVDTGRNIRSVIGSINQRLSDVSTAVSRKK